MGSKNKNRVTIFIVLGGYLAYLGIQLLQSVKSDEENKLLFMAIGVLFLVVGLVIVVLKLKEMSAIRKAEAEEEEEEESEDSEEYTETDENDADASETISEEDDE